MRDRRALAEPAGQFVSDAGRASRSASGSGPRPSLEIVEQAAALGNEVRRPRREWLSFLWSLKCSVRFLMRSERMATWTSGEPVSPLAVANSSISSCLALGSNRHRVFPFMFEETGRPQPGCRPAGASETHATWRDVAAHIMQFGRKSQRQFAKAALLWRTATPATSSI